MRALRRALLALVVVLAAGAGVFAAAWLSTPPANRLAQRVEERLLGTDARPVPISAVSRWFVRALAATEDERFYRHHGVDLVGLARAIPYDLVHASFAQGASTLTEQVAKALFLGGNDHAPWRKVEDMVLAVKLEDHYAKPQILDAYVNLTYFGDGATGIEAASERYFGVTARRLSLAQATLLAGLPQAPTAYDRTATRLRHALVRRKSCARSCASARSASPRAVRCSRDRSRFGRDVHSPQFATPESTRARRCRGRTR